MAIDRASKFAFAELHTESTPAVAVQFLRNLIAALSRKIHTVLTDNGTPFANQRTDRYAATHLFARVCEEHRIEH